MDGSFSTIPLQGWIAIASVISIVLTLIVMMIKAGMFSKRGSSPYSKEPFPRTDKPHVTNWFTSWSNWKSGIYKGKKLESKIAYVGHQVIRLNNTQAAFRSHGRLYAIKFLGFIFIGVIFLTGLLIVSKDYLDYRSWRGAGCSIFEVVDNEYVFLYRNKYDKSVAGFLQRKSCITKRIILDKKNIIQSVKR